MLAAAELKGPPILDAEGDDRLAGHARFVASHPRCDGFAAAVEPTNLQPQPRSYTRSTGLKMAILLCADRGSGVRSLSERRRGPVGMAEGSGQRPTWPAAEQL